MTLTGTLFVKNMIKLILETSFKAKKDHFKIKQNKGFSTEGQFQAKNSIENGKN